MRWYPRWPHRADDHENVEDVLRHTMRVEAYRTWLDSQLAPFFRIGKWYGFGLFFFVLLAVPSTRETQLYHLLADTSFPLFCTNLFGAFMLFEAHYRARAWHKYAKLRMQNKRPKRG